MKKYFIILLSGITAASFVFSGCGGKTNANSSLSSTQEKRFSFNLDKDYSFGDLSLKIDSKWKLTETKDVSVFLLNDSITLSMTKAEFNNSLMSEDDVFEIHSEPDSEHMVDTISNEKVSGNNVMLYSFIPTSKGDNEEYSRHLVTVIEDFSYDIYAKSKYADWQNCNSVIYELFKSLKMPQAKEESTDAALIQSTTEKTTEAPTEAVTEAPTEAPKTESVLFEENGIKIVFKGIGKDWLGQTAELRIENTSAKNYTVQVRDVSVNGFMVDPLFSCDVNSGKTANDQISFMESDFEKNDITSIEDIELSFHIFNADDWGEDFDSGTITVKP